MYGRDESPTISTVVGAVFWTLVKGLAFIGGMAALLALVVIAAAAVG
jgi:hypothetical protein